jgi:hypothetical protein
MFLAEDTAAALALAEEQADACKQCGMPKVWCRDNDHGRARFDLDEEFCWATYRIALRQKKQNTEKTDDAMRAAYVYSPKFVKGQEPDMLAGLGIND